jgi:predicted nucleotidyltransferase component of viral defense system
MSRDEASIDPLHEDPELFLEALNFTAATTAFAARLIEKDYFCSVLLSHIYKKLGALLVFKGGTCLAKVHAGFYRLSEDLDFMIPMPVESKRSDRRRQVEPLKKMIEVLPEELPIFYQVEQLRGSNESTQYVGVLGYQSLLYHQMETIKIEVGLREPLLMPATKQKTRTILLDPISNKPMVKPLSMACISRKEAYAEKFRAALTRREAAIRDFFDIDYAVRQLGLETREPSLVRLIQSKLEVPGNEPIDVTEKRLETLRLQKESHLRPVLRNSDYQAFDLERAFPLVREMASQLAIQR